MQIGLIDAPWDGGTTNRPGPRQLRDASTMIRAQNGITGIRPFEAARCADLVEVSPPFDASGATAYLGASIMFELLCMMV